MTILFVLHRIDEQEEKKCFTVEQPRDTPIVFAYEILDSGHEVEFNLYYGALAVQDLHISHKTLSDPVGHVDFTADNDGYYSICVEQSKTLKTDHPTRLKLSINYGYDNEYYEKLLKEHNFDAVNMEVHKLNDMMTMTLNEADFQKHKEVDYHSETEKMDNATLWWPMLQIGILVMTGIFQVRFLTNISPTLLYFIHCWFCVLKVQHLKSFFKSNKLI